MKLISVKILGWKEKFRSLTRNKLYQFNINQEKINRPTNRLSPKIFAGLNGSGKSNFLELLAEIFFYLEKFHMDSVPALEKKSKDFGFEIEYVLPLKTQKNDIGIFQFDEEGCHVRIKKELGQFPEFSYCKYGEKDFIRRELNTKQLLPTRVIAYTSGQNELLSNPFYRIRYHYFKESENRETIENDRLFFLDNSSNFYIFVSNMLLAQKEKLNYIKNILKVKGLDYFRITINLVDYQKKKIQLSKNSKLNIDKLKLCATTWVEKNEMILLDYKVNEATRLAFQFHFQSSFELFKAFYGLDNLNLHRIQKDTRSLILKSHNILNISEELAKPDPARLIFRIERIFLHKIEGEEENNTKSIAYKALSDGEHQFNEVIGAMLMMEEEGCLFLMDEPDTHFNPIWRAKMVQILNHVAAKSFSATGTPETVRNQEIIITTHSPFVISDSLKEDVYKFDKGIFESPDLQTYGSSIGTIMETVFDRDVSISDFSNDDLENLKKSILTIEDIKRVKKELLKFGESVEKFDAYTFLQEKEEELK